ncbi:LuxR family quorum-sensing system transcriptional regulator SolR [Roseateles asaccharophilus]|uniref:autoinducer binding domain-containing protein n=1 Tax=Roseateles asaccharophilus TaxID=582607 RepID=UPI00383253BB
MRKADLDDLQDVKTRAELLAALSRVGESMGFSTSSMVLRTGSFFGKPSYTDVNNAPKEWVELASNPALHAVDPVFYKLNTSREPFIYDQDFYARNGAADFWDMAAPYGFFNGVSASLMMGADGLLFWGFDSEDGIAKDEAKRLRLVADTMLIGVYAASAAERILAPPKPSLTERHLEILRLVKAGKSSSVIGQLIGISENTVDFHVKRLCALLGVASRHQALAKVLEMGMLT